MEITMNKIKSVGPPAILKPKWFAVLLIIVGVVGLISSSVLTLDKLHVLRDPNYNPACNINPVFSCGSVMKTKQAEIAGAPNTLLGLVAFPALITVGAVMLFGARMSKRFWQLFQVVTLFGLAGIIYLFFQGVYRINALCIYCLSVWVVVLALVWYTTLWNWSNNYVSLPKSFSRFQDWALKHHLDVLILMYLSLILAILQHFWYYFGPVLGLQ
jgi:uncharacterized membrane protein